MLNCDFEKFVFNRLMYIRLYIFVLHIIIAIIGVSKIHGIIGKINIWT